MSKKQLAPANNYEVGYGKPPNTTRFAKGQSGNPLGRPKGSKTKRSKARDHRSQKLLMDMIRIVEATKDEQKESEEEIQINVVFEGNDSRSRLK